MGGRSNINHDKPYRSVIYDSQDYKYDLIQWFSPAIGAPVHIGATGMSLKLQKGRTGSAR